MNATARTEAIGATYPLRKRYKLVKIVIAPAVATRTNCHVGSAVKVSIFKLIYGEVFYSAGWSGTSSSPVGASLDSCAADSSPSGTDSI